MTDSHDQRALSTLKRFTADWLNQAMPAGVLVTVTNFTLSRDHDYATVFVSVFPENREAEIRETFRRQGHELHAYLGEHIRTHIPFVRLEIDWGEKNRQQVEEIISQAKKS